MIQLPRRHLLLGGLTLAAAAACAQKTILADPAEPVPPIHERIEALQRRHNAKIGMYAVDLDTGRSITYLDGETFAVCSTFKAYASARLLQKSERGELSLADTVTIEPDDLRSNSPVTETRVGKSMTLAELCQAALQVSDNAAANWLLRLIGGPSAITDFARSIGDDKTRLDRWETELNSAVPGDPRDTSTPHALGTGFRNLLTGDVLQPATRTQLEAWMRANQTSSMRAVLPPEWTTVDKTGAGDYGSTNDVGIAYGPDGQRLLMAVMTRSQGNDPNAESLRPLIGELTTLAIPWLLA